jgi:hypothetical protein
VPSDTQTLQPWSDDDVVRRLLLPVLPGIRAVGIGSGAHRGIRPSNIFFRDAARQQAILGDCFTSPPARHQPAVYETIESAMATPSGRGGGTMTDDLYALGVLVLYLLLGRPPGQELSDGQLLADKIRRGSYAALAADTRISLGMMEMLRGLLIDDARERWTADDLELWLQGRRLSPRLSNVGTRASRPFEVGGEACVTGRTLAAAIARAGESAAPAVRGHDFAVWLQRSLGDKAVGEAVDLALADEGARPASPTSQDSRLVARVAVALDPTAPIRYRSLAVAVGGIGAALATASLGGGEAQHFGEMVLARLPQFWSVCQGGNRPENVAIEREFDRLRKLLDDSRAGFGIERLVYELNSGIHCLSPLVESRWVETRGELLPALEAAAGEGRIEGLPIDRYVAAFIADRWRKFPDHQIAATAGSDAAARILGQLQTLAMLQAEQGPVSLPALTALFVRRAGTVIERHRSKAVRAQLEAELPALEREGSLIRLVQHLDNREEKNREAERFARARAQYAALRRKLEQCAKDRRTLPLEAAETGATIAMTLSVGLAGIALLAAFLAASPG